MRTGRGCPSCSRRCVYPFPYDRRETVGAGCPSVGSPPVSCGGRCPVGLSPSRRVRWFGRVPFPLSGVASVPVRPFGAGLSAGVAVPRPRDSRGVRCPSVLSSPVCPVARRPRSGSPVIRAGGLSDSMSRCLCRRSGSPSSGFRAVAFRRVAVRPVGSPVAVRRSRPVPPFGVAYTVRVALSVPSGAGAGRGCRVRCGAGSPSVSGCRGGRCCGRRPSLSGSPSRGVGRRPPFGGRVGS